MHDKTLKRFRVSIREFHPNFDASIASLRRQYQGNQQRLTRLTLHRIEVFDR